MLQTENHKDVPFTFIRQRIYYFSKRVPADLTHHYRYPRIVQSLRTRSSYVAKTRSLIEAARLDEYWSHLRMQNTDMLGKHLLLNPEDMIGLSSAGDQGNGPTLGEALATYLELMGSTKSKTFFTAATRSCGYLVEVCGKKTLLNYTRADAIAFRNELTSRNLIGRRLQEYLVLCVQ